MTDPKVNTTPGTSPETSTGPGSAAGGPAASGDAGIAASPSQRAAHPGAITLQGWWRIARRIFATNQRENLVVLAAGIGFFAMLSVFPALTAFISFYGLLADPGEVQQHAVILQPFLPTQGWTLLEQHMARVVEARDTSLGVGGLLSLVIALWSAGAGLRATMSALNASYREQEKRGLFRFYGTALLFTLGVMAVGLLSLGVIVGVPVVLDLLQLGRIGQLLVTVLPWLLLLAVVLLGVGMLYRFGPSRRAAKVRWISPGAIAATLLWLLFSLGFSLYVAFFGSYNQTYGTLGAVAALLTWFWLSAYALLLGATLNAEAEHETSRDTTVGATRPIGEREAWVADHLAGTRTD
ncbi:MAG: YihY/virulence factor BrkB family protein [Sneathiellaceae bacterium]